MIMTARMILAMGLMVVFMIPGTSWALEAKSLDVKVVGIETIELDGSDLVRVVLDITNNGVKEANFFSTNFDLLDSQLREYGSTSGYDIRQKGGDVSRGVCDAVFGNSANPGLSVEFDICFEVPKDGFQYDSILIYENALLQVTSKALVVPLVDNSVGYDTIVNQVEIQDEDLAERADDLGGGGCLIATAAYGTELVPEIQNLREIRNRIYETEMGGDVMLAINDFYYSFSPTIADWELQNNAFRESVRLFITPAMMSFSIMDHANIESEESLITYVLGIVTLNVGIYVIAPTAAVIIVRSQFKT